MAPKAQNGHEATSDIVAVNVMFERNKFDTTTSFTLSAQHFKNVSSA